jgi:LysR family transcriptional regulator, transcriptional activator of the cysJI operon
VDLNRIPPILLQTFLTGADAGQVSEAARTEGVNGTLTLAASTTVARYFVPRIFIRFHHYHPAVALHLIVGNSEEVLDHLRQQHVGLGLAEGHQRSPGVHLEQFMPDEIVPVCAPSDSRPKAAPRD